MRNFRKKTLVVGMLLASVLGFTNQEVNAEIVRLKQDVQLSKIVDKNQKIIKPNFAQIMESKRIIAMPGQEYLVSMNIQNDTKQDITIENDSLMQIKQTLYLETTCDLEQRHKYYHDNVLEYAFNGLHRSNSFYKSVTSYKDVEYLDINQIVKAYTPAYNVDKNLLANENLRFDIHFRLNDAQVKEECNETLSFDFDAHLPYKNLNRVEKAVVNGKKNEETTTQVTLDLDNDIDKLSAKDIVLNNKNIKVSDVELKNRKHATYTFNINGEWKQDEKITLNVEKDDYVIKDNEVNLVLNKAKETSTTPPTTPNNNVVTEESDINNIQNQDNLDDTSDDIETKNSEQEINEPLSYEEDDQVLLDDEDENSSTKKKKKQPKLSGSIQTFSNDLVLPVFEDETAQINFDENLMVTYYLVIAGITLTGYVLYQRRFEK